MAGRDGLRGCLVMLSHPSQSGKGPVDGSGRPFWLRGADQMGTEDERVAGHVRRA